MQQDIYGTLQGGTEVRAFTMQNKNGLRVRCISYGCRVTNIWVPNPGGQPVDVVLGFDNLAGYEADATFQGTLVGRYANRIRGAGFKLGDKWYGLIQNEGDNYLHGLLHQRVFEAEVIGENSIAFTYTSPEGEEGFPGEVWLGVTYTLTEDNELVMDFRGKSTADTHLNLTNHAYFNLAGEGDVLGHALRLNSGEFLEADSQLLPTGQTLPVEDGPFDFRREKPVGRDIASQDAQLAPVGGYDHCFVLDKNGTGIELAAELRHPQSGRALRVFTTQPAVQLYTSNMLDVPLGKGGAALKKYAGLCLEAQHYPDSPNHPEFPSTLVMAGEKYRQATVLHFLW